MTEAAALALLQDATVRMEHARQNIYVLADTRTECVHVLREHGWTYAAIADMIGLTPQAVAKIARRWNNG